MPLLRMSGSSLQSESALEQRLMEAFQFKIGYSPSLSERRSWQRSLPVLADDLKDAGLSNVEVLMEYQLPLTSKRADAVLAGTHPRTGRPSYVVVELKQWSAAASAPEGEDLVHIEAFGRHPLLHPVEQVRRHTQFLTDFTRALEHEPDAVVGAAYLHNASETAIHGLRAFPESEGARMFTQSTRGAWLEFLRSRLSSETPGAGSADLLVNSRLAPSRQLLTVAAAEITEREQFTLLDEQQVAFTLVANAVEQARGSDRKTVVIVTGGPGSGKSVIALSLLGEMSRRGYAALHATGSAAFTSTMRRVAGHRNRRVQQMFHYFNQFGDAPPNSLDLLICDEAHRIRETSVNRFTRAAARADRRPQVEELMGVARVPVFLLDEHQVVRPGEVGRVSQIAAAAERLGHKVEIIELDAQFRSGGSRVYEEWVLRLLGLTDGGPVPWDGDEHSELEVADSPEELEGMLRSRRAEGYSARMTAGFCWPWSDAQAGQLVPDVRIGDWHRPWNNKLDRALGDAPARALWASMDGGFGQIGCVYTAQGFEYDWNGVIIGPDLLWRYGTVTADPSASRDPGFRGVPASEVSTLIRNVYKVLLTRGMVGTVLFSTDRRTNEFFHELVSA